MKRKVRVSVIIPCYNHEKYIKQSIESVLNQSYTDFELLIADDCSPDNSRHIINSFDDPRIIKFFHKENSGVVARLNELIANAGGEYIAVLGSDDFWLPDKLKKQVELLDQNTDIGACFSYAEVVDENNQPFPDDGSFPIKVFFEKNKTQAEWLRLFFSEGNHLCHSSVLIRKSIHNEIGVYNPAYRQLHDFDMWVRLIIHYPITMLEEVLVRYRRVANKSISASTTENDIRVINELHHIISRMIITLKEDLLITGFGDLFEKESGNIDCERFFIFSKYKIAGVQNLQPALEYLFNMNLFPALKEQYGFNINDVYEYTGREVIYYPSFLISELKSMQGHCEDQRRYYESQIESMKSHCEDQRRRHESQIESMKSHHESQIESMKSHHESQIESMKSHHESHIESIKNEFINSTSWKITKPLRMFSKAIRKGK